MTIGSYQAFNSLVENDNIQPFNTLKECISSVNRICNCQKQRKNNKSEECNRLYIHLINTVAVNMIDYFKSKTNDNEITFTHTGPHVIKTIKLR